ncbi:Predicted kinase, aminoglycoside phosphotransferase (APT) family [Cribrihabitans marinus]|uniref:Predicted kinase, aminoglycoside phosphotransferase (APT) family n=1 Tax=Cribrihabitans marinus TaxID=1227549 RepID=A0A1H6Q5N0_9RHOB|nr:phosphotransferase family protein [Cribrihabitans marinus]GGH18019.1 aminoglycoside phosphotransferase [Cribrihabitans marinus]SEI39131.1 Predicted kinase, aminoglycoside phosphotransferase (APT) family [Cribrihabitans marinus]
MAQESDVLGQGGQDLDTDAVAAYLENRLEGFRGPVAARKFETGQSNPTYLLETPGQRYVLRRKPMGAILKSAHAVEREFRVQQALGGTQVPVPRMHLLCEDPEVIGSAFYVMEHLDGRNFAEPLMPDLDAEARGAVIDEMNRVLAALHEVDIEAAGLDDFGPGGNYFERQIARWTKQYRAAETQSLPEMEELIAALPAALPGDDGQRTLVHGDYRIDNLMFRRDGTGCLGVLDWELSTIGHPYADLAAVIMQWQLPPGREGRGLAGIRRAEFGLPEDAAFIEAYCRRRDIAGIERFGFYLSFAFFRMAGILQGVYKRALDGNASNPEHGFKLGGYVPTFAQMGLRALER